MRVLVTGATGFVGAWTAKAVADAGHDLRLLVRTPAKLGQTLRAIGVEGGEVVAGDMTDDAAVREAVAGCDAVVHAAAVVSMQRAMADEMLRANELGARTVLGRAAESGLDPIVTVSSVASLFRPRPAVLHPELPLAEPQSAYGKSKALAEEYARSLQADGVPVVITYPGGVVGPPAGDAFGEAGTAVLSMLTLPMVPSRGGALPIVDVRDVAAAHAAILEPGRGPRRYMLGGRVLTMAEAVALIELVTGNRLKVLPFPARGLRAIGAAVDRVAKVFPFDTVFTKEAMSYYTQQPDSDDGPAKRELGITFRDPAETLADVIAGLFLSGQITAAQAGKVAERAIPKLRLVTGE